MKFVNNSSKKVQVTCKNGACVVFDVDQEREVPAYMESACLNAGLREAKAPAKKKAAPKAAAE